MAHFVGTWEHVRGLTDFVFPDFSQNREIWAMSKSPIPQTVYGPTNTTIDVPTLC